MADWNSKANELFLQAAEVESQTERRRFLDQHCGDDADLRAQVESLLAVSAKVGSFLNEPAAQALPPSGGTVDYEPIVERPGTIIGPYRLMEQIGEGGMGLVFVAEQQHPVRRRVALKIIKPGMDSRQVIARFEAERQALALMDHQNIAKVYDAGTTESGRPYFVMELVHGVPITDYCDANQLTPRQRLELFVPVCQAIQHAHQKGIIHRDIKPSNVLVTMYDDKPVPKVIDFGVAKAIEQRLTEKTVYTQFGTLVGTFEYMSPEQAEMNAFGVDTRSDIYALGVLLYELMTGTTPLERQRLREAAFGEIVRLIKEEEPPRPSVRLSTSGTLAKVAAARKTEPVKLSRLMRGELDWIVMKALEKDRARRYETASGLARDIQHYLADEPVEACPPSAGYRLRKLARKHQKPLAASAAFAVLLLAGAVVSTWQAVRATRAETAARAAEEEARIERDRARIEGEAARAAEEEATIERDRARVEKENTQAVLGFLWQDVLSQASPFYGSGGRDLKIRTVLDRAADRLNSGARQPPLLEASIRSMMGQLYAELGEINKAKPHLEKVVELRCRELGEEDPQTLAASEHLATSLFLGNRYDEAAPIYRRTLELRRKVQGEKHPDTVAEMGWAGACYAAMGRFKEGELMLRQRLDALSRLPGNHDRDRLRTQWFLGLSLVARGNLDEAETELTNCLDGSRKALDPDDSPTLAVLRTLSWVYVSRDDAARAEPLAVEAVERYRRRLGDQAPYTLTGIRFLARVRQLQGRYTEAAPLIAEAEAGYRSLQQEDDPRLASVLGMLGHNLIAEKKYAEATPPLHECLEIWEKRLPHGGEFWFALSPRGAAREYAFAKSLLGASLLGQKDFAGAERLLLEGYGGLKQQPGVGEDATPLARRHQAEALGWLVQLYDEWGKPDKAAEWRAKQARPSDEPKQRP